MTIGQFIQNFNQQKQKNTPSIIKYQKVMKEDLSGPWFLDTICILNVSKLSLIESSKFGIYERIKSLLNNKT